MRPPALSLIHICADIDLLGAAYGGSEDLSKGAAAEKYANVLEWVPIQQHTPNLDGLGHTIDHLYINATAADDTADYQGLFGRGDASYEKIDSRIANTFIGANSYVRGNNYVGAFIGGANSVSIVNCSNAAEVEGASCVGGIEGSNGGTRGYTSGLSLIHI